MQKVRTQMKRNQVDDKHTGRVDLRYNPMSIEEDYFIPIRGGTSSRVESLPGGTYTGDIDDVKYLRDKLFSALKIPASYLSRGEGSDEDKTTLAQKDIRFARTIQRLQRAVISELEKVGVIHLFTLGYRGSDLLTFRLALNNPSKIAELQELEHWRTKFDVAGAATEGFFSKRWIAKNLFNVSEDEFVRMQRESFHDKKFAAMLEKAAEQITAGEEGAAGGDDLVGDLGGDLGGGDLGGDLGAELGGDETGGEAPEAGAEAPEADTPEPEGGGDEGVLLAAPVIREEDAKPGLNKKYRKNYGGVETTTSKSKGKWYLPTKDDKRDMGGRNKGMKINREMASSTRRNIYKGYDPLRSLAKLSEGQEYIHDQEEKQLFEVNYEIKKLIKDMESMETVKNEVQT